MTAEDRKLVLALVALATRDGLGEPVDWDDVKAAVAALTIDPVGPRDLRAVAERLNDGAVAATLEDWFVRASVEREGDAQAAARAGEKLLAPLQIVGLGGATTAAIGVAVGTVGLAIGAPLIGATLAVGAAASYGRWRLSKREDEARVDAGAIQRMATLIAKSVT